MVLLGAPGEEGALCASTLESSISWHWGSKASPWEALLWPPGYEGPGSPFLNFLSEFLAE